MDHLKTRSPHPAVAGHGLHVVDRAGEPINPVVTPTRNTRPASPKPRRTHIFEKDPHAHYVEPFWVSERLFEVEFFGAPGTRLIDPACGWGRILKSAQKARYTVEGADIADRLDRQLVGRIPFRVTDFLKHTRDWSSVELIVTNPPFDHLEKFCERAIELVTYKVAMLVPLQRLPAARWLQGMPLETVYLLTPRPSMPPGSYIASGKKPGGGRPDFAWLVFNKLMTPAAPRMRWLHRDKDEP